MADDRLAIAHLLRRTSFGPFPGMVEEWLPGGYAGALNRVLDAAPLQPFPMPAATDDLATPWLRSMRHPEALLHERMVWFWHGHLTSSTSASENSALYQQHLLLRRHALGNFRDLIQAITVDAAMLQYLNGDGSTADSPNENYGRELMELFTLGRGAYQQSDVRAAARALAGYSTNGSAVSFDPSSANKDVLSFLGRSGTFSAGDVCDMVCDHPACAPFIAGKVHRFLVGTAPSPARREELAAIFRAANLEIRPLVTSIIRSDSFGSAVRTRPRTGVEWLVPASAVLNIDVSSDQAGSLGQVPFAPPNVAGWPAGTRWLAPSLALARAAIATGAAPPDDVINAPDIGSAALQRSALYDVSAESRMAVASSALLADRQQAAVLALATSVCSPEFVMA